MGQPRYTGVLKKWNTERGFGFITADDGGQDVFAHISAFARGGGDPRVGEALSFEVEPDRNGKRSAVRVRRPGDPVREPTPSRPLRLRKSRNDNAPGFFSSLFGLLLFCAVAFYAYSKYSTRAAVYDSTRPALAAAPAASISPGKLPVPANFKCDGRNMCSQMSSCQEATLFLQNCPGMKMDGNGDGVPCEQQFCFK